jgi:hypothetical protein
VLVLVPVKDAAPRLPNFLEKLCALDWPREHRTLGFLESDSVDGTFSLLQERLPALREQFARVTLLQRHFGYRPEGARHEPGIQLARRSILARSRNLLWRGALADEEWVLWLDADLVDFPRDLLQRLLAPGAEVAAPLCTSARTGRTFDLNTFRVHPEAANIDTSPWVEDGLLQPPEGLGREYLGDLRGHAEVPLDSVGCAALLLRADLLRQGLEFPEAPVEGLIESEGLALLARRRGARCVGLPQVEVVHA